MHVSAGKLENKREKTKADLMHNKLGYFQFLATFDPNDFLIVFWIKVLVVDA